MFPIMLSVGLKQDLPLRLFPRSKNIPGWNRGKIYA
jgi:hypothetical protein